MLGDVDEAMREHLLELEAANEGLRREIDQIRRDEEGLRLGEQRYRSLVEATTALILPPSLKSVGIYAVYLLVVFIRPRGLFGSL